MTARTGMADLISQVRGLAYVGTADFTVGTVSYWSDDQIQQSLDRHRINIYQEALEPRPVLGTANDYQYYEYHARLGNLESGTIAGSAVFIVQQYNGGSAPTYTPDYNTGIITFTADTEGTAYMLSARSYDLNAAAADIWRGKAAFASQYFDFSTDNHSIKKSQFYTQCLEMASYFSGISQTQSFNVTTMYRSDVVKWGGDE